MLFPLIFRMLRARWPVVVIAVGCSLAGGAYIALTAPPRYQATARVEMQFVKASQGENLMNKKAAQAYITSQIQMIRDYQVAVPAAEALGLLDDPDLQSQFGAIPDANPDDFPAWIGGQIIGSTFVRQVADSNMLEIGYTAATPQAALQSVDAVRSAYIQATINAQRAGALDTAKNLDLRVAYSSKGLERLEAAKRDLETASGGMPEDEALRLTQLVGQRVPRPIVVMPRRDRLPVRLADAETELVQATRVLGPNNPNLARLRSARDALKAQIDAEASAATSTASIGNVIERARQAQIEEQKRKVLSLRQAQLEMRLLDDEIAGRTAIIKAMNEKIATLRAQATYQDVGLAPVGDAEAKPAPVFPNVPLILVGTGVLGLALGSMLAILVEFLHRRARSAREFEISAGTRLLGVVPYAASARPARPAKAAKQHRAQKSRARPRAAA